MVAFFENDQVASSLSVVLTPVSLFSNLPIGRTLG
jgi:hypothetical protein